MTPIKDEEIQQLREEARALIEAETLHMLPTLALIASIQEEARQVARLLDEVDRLKEALGVAEFLRAEDADRRMDAQLENAFGAIGAAIGRQASLNPIEKRLREENVRLKKATEQTIEVLEDASPSKRWHVEQVKPLLDNLKALRDGGE